MAKRAKHWMQKAVPESHKGLFTAKAKRAGKSVQEYAREKAHAGGTLGHEAQFALRAQGVADKNKKGSRAHKRATLYGKG